MRLLLDTHAFLWFINEKGRLSRPVEEAIEDVSSQVFVSAASALEIAVKFRLGRLPGAAAVAADVVRVLNANGFDPLPISVRHAQASGELKGGLKDPFDRLLIAQALLEGLILVSDETAFDRFGVRRLW